MLTSAYFFFQACMVMSRGELSPQNVTTILAYLKKVRLSIHSKNCVRAGSGRTEGHEPHGAGHTKTIFGLSRASHKTPSKWLIIIFMQAP